MTCFKISEVSRLKSGVIYTPLRVIARAKPVAISVLSQIASSVPMYWDFLAMTQNLMSNLTPLMNQYHRIKSEHKNSILFFRLGDFYEMFEDDAKTVSKILRLTLTSRQNVPMCGIPHHSYKYYVARLIKEGFSVAVCEQMEDPSKAKGLVKREVVRVITSGTVLEENLLEAKINNFLCAIYPALPEKTFRKGRVHPFEIQNPDNIGIRNGTLCHFAVAFIDVSTGDFFYQTISDDQHCRKLNLQLAKYTPSEILLPKSCQENLNLIKTIKKEKTILTFMDDINFSPEIGGSERSFQRPRQDLVAGDRSTGTTGSKDPVLPCDGILRFEMGMEENENTKIVCSAIISYIQKTQPNVLTNIRKIRKITNSDFMVLDELVIKNLELVEGFSSGNRSGSLFEIMDKTITSMGARLIRKSILEPLLDTKNISERYDAVEFFITNGLLRMEIREILSNCQDIERLLSRISAQTANGRDLIALKKSLMVIPLIKNKISEVIKSSDFLGNSEIIKNYFSDLKTVDEVVHLIEKSIMNEPPATIKEGGLIKTEYNSDLDELKFVSRNAKDWIAKFETDEKQRTRIQSLKVRYNSVFGYFIEITKANLDKVPQDYIRKQTISNGERFITEALKQKEAMIFGAEEKISALEYEIFLEIRQEIIRNIEVIQTNAKAIAGIDMFSALSELAVENRYIRPSVNSTSTIKITDGRHPVIEKILGGQFVPNDILLGNEKRIAIITGPNMSGKSTYLRQTALIIILAQMGSFVPAKEAEIGIVDSIFTRIGASDRLTQGESTFMVEMKEVSNILGNATKKSFILLDEVGRGTSTFDGLSIAWATIEYLRPLGAKVLFATHYFELTELADIYAFEIINLSVSVKEWKDDVLFLHKIVEGSADKSYGIHVAKIAGLPKKVIDRSEELLAFFEKNYNKKNPEQTELFIPPDEKILTKSPILDEIEKTNPDELSPKDALEKLYEWKKRIK
ncbi:MAG: DNA mismatch repair protein MutS [Elusimicrobiota bacterium]